jgi:hypothetical protein
MALSRTAYVNKLRAEKGYKEGRNNWTKFPPAVPGLEWAQNQPWCHTFVSWAADELAERGALPITAGCFVGVDWFKDRGRWTDYPVLGGLFYMGPGGGTHVGVVYAYDETYIYTIEGNTNTDGSANGDGVYERRRPRRGAGSPYGYGVPYFSEKTVSADPEWGGTKAASVPRNSTPEVEEVALTDADVNKILAARILIPDSGGKMVSVADILAWTDNRHNVIYKEVRAANAKLDQLLKGNAA